jgi:peroxiredoxin
MARTFSTMLELGVTAPHFSLPDTHGTLVCRDDFKNAKGLLVIFMCNHCPYVIHLRQGLAAFALEYRARGLAVVGINSNDASNYPDDAPEKMVIEAERAGYTFPYLYDKTQEVAKAYRAACTPDLFLFDNDGDGDMKLVYRGQFDDSRPKNDIPITGRDLRTAVDALLEHQPIPSEQKPSMGCNIKWKPGNEPDYYG